MFSSKKFCTFVSVILIPLSAGCGRGPRPNVMATQIKSQQDASGTTENFKLYTDDPFTADSIPLANGNYTLKISAGNLELSKSGSTIWSIGDGQADLLIMQRDCNLVLQSKGKPIWSSQSKIDLKGPSGFYR